jgi:hypothetical protein
MDQLANLNVNTELFPYLTGERFLWGFPRLDLASGEFPQPTCGTFRISSACQHASVADDDGRDNT